MPPRRSRKNSTTNTLAVNYVPYVTVTPPAAVFATNVTVTISSSFGSRLQLHLEQEGAARDQFTPPATHSDLGQDNPPRGQCRALTHYAFPIHQQLQGQVTCARHHPRRHSSGWHDPTISPIIARTPTPGAHPVCSQFRAVECQCGRQHLMNEGTNYYRIKATRLTGWTATRSASRRRPAPPSKPSSNYVGRYYTLLPDLPLHISPANTALVDTPHDPVSTPHLDAGWKREPAQGDGTRPERSGGNLPFTTRWCALKWARVQWRGRSYHRSSRCGPSIFRLWTRTRSSRSAPSPMTRRKSCSTSRLVADHPLQCGVAGRGRRGGLQP